MTYRVYYTDTFRSDIAAHVGYLRQQHVSGVTIEHWYDRLFSKLDELATWPKNWPVDTHATSELGRETRKLIYARFIITYHIEENPRRVVLLRMIHGAR